MATQALTQDEIQAELAKLNGGDTGWRVIDGKLSRTYQFHDFVEAFGFMTRAALIAERMNHHPEWFNVYRTVRVDLTTHDAGGISPLDFELAAAMDRIAG
jgi:4a-hydroxytetrahydrobiopterin dehydratase